MDPCRSSDIRVYYLVESESGGDAIINPLIVDFETLETSDQWIGVRYYGIYDITHYSSGSGDEHVPQ